MQLSWRSHYKLKRSNVTHATLLSKSLQAQEIKCHAYNSIVEVIIQAQDTNVTHATLLTESLQAQEINVTHITLLSKSLQAQEDKCHTCNCIDGVITSSRDQMSHMQLYCRSQYKLKRSIVTHATILTKSLQAQEIKCHTCNSIDGVITSSRDQMKLVTPLPPCPRRICRLLWGVCCVPNIN